MKNNQTRRNIEKGVFLDDVAPIAFDVPGFDTVEINVFNSRSNAETVAAIEAFFKEVTAGRVTLPDPDEETFLLTRIK